MVLDPAQSNFAKESRCITSFMGLMALWGFMVQPSYHSSKTWLRINTQREQAAAARHAYPRVLLPYIHIHIESHQNPSVSPKAQSDEFFEFFVLFFGKRTQVRPSATCCRKHEEPLTLEWSIAPTTSDYEHLPPPAPFGLLSPRCNSSRKNFQIFEPFWGDL